MFTNRLLCLGASAGALSLRGSGCRNLALPGVYEQASTLFPASYPTSLLQNLTHTSSPSRSCHSALNAGVAPEETVEIPSHVTRGLFGADIGGVTKAHPKKGAATEERRREMPQRADALRVAPIFGSRYVAKLARSTAATLCARLLAIFRKLTATWHTRVFQHSPMRLSKHPRMPDGCQFLGDRQEPNAEQRRRRSPPRNPGEARAEDRRPPEGANSLTCVGISPVSRKVTA